MFLIENSFFLFLKSSIFNLNRIGLVIFYEVYVVKNV